MNTIDEAIEILQAMKAGKTIQIQGQGGVWADRSPGAADVLPRFDANNYRVKLDPVFDWIVESKTKRTDSKWAYCAYSGGLTEKEMKDRLDEWNNRSENYVYRARKITPVEEALT